MKRILVLFAAIALSGCSLLGPVPTITVTNGAATVTPNAQASSLANAIAADDAAAINLACAVTPPATAAVDPQGCAFFTDISQLAALSTAPANPAGVLSTIEAASLAVGQISAPSALEEKTLVDGAIWIQKIKAQGLAVPLAVQGLMNQVLVAVMA